MRLAVDVSLYLYKYKAVCGERWPDAFLNLICCLRENEVHCVFVFDGASPPDKDEERKRRRDERDKTTTKAKNLMDDIRNFEKSGTVTPLILSTLEKRRNDKTKRLLSTLSTDPSVNIDIEYLRSEAHRISKQSVHLTTDDTVTAKRLFEVLIVPYIQADGEAEALCAMLCVHGKVEGVLSEDTDVLAYGSPLFIHGLNTRKAEATRLQVSDILETLELDQQLFTDLCIMCGTDYNSNMKGIGPMKALALLRQYKSIENIADVKDTKCLRHERCRELFSPDYNLPETVSFCGCPPDWGAVESFILSNSCSVSMIKIRRAFAPRELIFD